ncbi:MAG: trypsin-like peptidase domain-containing protein [Patescibacteria group bacterium]|jgi:serine protease Do
MEKKEPSVSESLTAQNTRPVGRVGVSGQPAADRAIVTYDQLRNLAIAVLVVSLLVGALSGLVFGAWASTDSSVSSWVQKNIFRNSNTTSVASTGSITPQTLAVTEDSATVDVVKKASPAVVSIVITQDLSKIYNNSGSNLSPFGDLFNFGTPSQGQQEIGAGSGFIISSDGLIMTNKHVVSTTGAEYTVVMNDGKKYSAKVLATDPFNDVAVVKIDATDLPTLALGDSSTVQIGQSVIAIGNALGQYQNTVTKGVVSGLSRTVTAGDGSGQSETLQDIIQTDAAINSGNSGGPLLDLAGQVIGINTAVNSSGQLVGFAIPINQVKSAVESVKKNGTIVRPYLGVRYVIINSDVAEKNKLSVDYGAMVVRGADQTEFAVIPGSPADKAGIVENDIILEVNSQKINEEHPLASELQKYNVGDSVTLKISHAGTEKTVSVKLEQAKP